MSCSFPSPTICRSAPSSWRTISVLCAIACSKFSTKALPSRHSPNKPPPPRWSSLKSMHVLPPRVCWSVEKSCRRSWKEPFSGNGCAVLAQSRPPATRKCRLSSFTRSPNPCSTRTLSKFLDAFVENLANGQRTFVLADSEKQQERLRDILAELMQTTG